MGQFDRAQLPMTKTLPVCQWSNWLVEWKLNQIVLVGEFKSKGNFGVKISIEKKFGEKREKKFLKCHQNGLSTVNEFVE